MDGLEKRKVEDCLGLPTGWKREEVIRKSGLSAGKTDIYYFSPCGRKFRSKPQLARFLGDSFDLSAFDFRSGKQLSSGARKSKRLKNIQYDYSRGLKHDASLVLPIRQTASIFKQPVTLKTNHGQNRIKADPKQDAKDVPKQLFWEKRLSNLTACDSVERVLRAFDVPDNLVATGPGLTDENILQSISSSLHLSNHPITGQTSSKSLLEKNPGVYLNVDQPPVIKFTITDGDIRRQEDIVKSLRERLQKVIEGDVDTIKAEMEAIRAELEGTEAVAQGTKKSTST
ncbi:Methyl-CpG-binding domain protein 2 [Holothuria leucospilota]|uniref:Methyl-CpG-binding domain protein 2 n=1 Tax=Holothuria leucospilota TaxID=206669 RepID=A0A9Q1BM21_HOLLE|nr:Methyl-CpG-binding domain protein 2 [Holothuria leucospilota]